ncbi:DNA replication licensing factor MCM2 [Strongyloides ratti]|uniref:DNA replication licensing factor MCM2 n=1 Tax=Strongyloides ratti TaxID=34506 RepID=A0A090L9U3_STRRB|nr:DNA replication licensing factor MCM2 [Strongyloides ratti]CEF64250.1 DNA replication licensing factor MCM2 [Strongyloides ratti]
MSNRGSQNNRRRGNRRVPTDDEDARNSQNEVDVPEQFEELYGNEAEDEPVIDDGEDGEDLFGDNYEDDYQENPELDQLSLSGVDDEEHEELDIGERRNIERQMNIRDGRIADFDFLESGSTIGEALDYNRTRRANVDDADVDMLDSVEHAPAIDIENMRGRTATQHCSDPAVQKEIKYRFTQFLRFFTDSDGFSKYFDAIKAMVAENKTSIRVSFDDLESDKGELVIAYYIPEAPNVLLPLLNEALTDYVSQNYSYFAKEGRQFEVRFDDMTIFEDLRTLRQHHLNTLLKTTGIVTITTGILPRLAVIKYNCKYCSFVVGPFVQRPDEEVKPKRCPSCQTTGPFEINTEETVYQNYQRITIQESPSDVEAGRLPRSKDVVLTGDLCDTCKPGDEVIVHGVYTNNYDGSMNAKHGFPVFNTLILANNIVKKDEMEGDGLTDEDINEIKELSKDPRIADRIFASIAPSIYGHEDIKRAIALSLFRGNEKNPGEKHRIRGDINVLLCGDPGTAKSQFLRYAQHIAPRAVLTTGQGASAVGLTAYVQRHPVTREWTLEAGAMVLADRGVCLIDEFDKMNDQDRTSIHEAMEQQSISISKAGIVSSLQARCTVIAAANPIGGRYDSSRTFADNVDLTEPILSRFDILCVVRDIHNSVEDEKLAKFVIGNHKKLHPDNSDDEEENDENVPLIDEKSGLKIIKQGLLKKYIMYAREKIHPKLEGVPYERISNLFVDMRTQSKITGSVAITVRHVESMIRMAEAHAKMHLRQYVNEDDVNTAINVMFQSFVETQKVSVKREMKKIFSKHLNLKSKIGAY